MLKREIEGYRADTSERDATIGDKEKRIYELKKRNQGIVLRSYIKFLLKYKVTEK